MAASARPASTLRLADLRTAREKDLYTLSLVLSVPGWLWLGVVAFSGAEALLPILLYAAVIFFVVLTMQGILVGNLRANGIKVGPKQFPELHRLVTDHARRIGMTTVPDVYVIQGGGTLNAFATKFFSRRFVVLYSDVLELAYEQGEAAVGFVVAHELGHHHRGHLDRRWLTLPSRFIPYLGAAYSRACEFTCDRYGAYCQPDGAYAGLLVLAAGKSLYGRVNLQEYMRQAETEKGYWVKRAELMSTHPSLPKRLAALARAGVPLPAPATLPVPSYSPMQATGGAPAVA